MISLELKYYNQDLQLKQTQTVDKISSVDRDRNILGWLKMKDIESFRILAKYLDKTTRYFMPLDQPAVTLAFEVFILVRHTIQSCLLFISYYCEL